MSRFLKAIVGLSIVGGFAWYVSRLAKDLKMPETRDRKLWGHWIGRKTEKPPPRFREIEFLSNGTAQVPGMSQIRWGTIDGTLHVVGRASGTDWMNGVYEYAFDKKHRSVKFKAQPLSMLPIELVRR